MPWPFVALFRSITRLFRTWFLTGRDAPHRKSPPVRRFRRPDVTVTGNDNFVVVAGRDAYVLTTPAGPPAGDDRRNLAHLLGHVRRFWITSVLERSVSHAALLDPPVHMEPDVVDRPWQRYLEAAGEPAGLLSPDTTIGQVFDDAERMLLILGEPGAGKTTTLLTLARECVEQAERDPAAPVPVVLNLSSWTGTRPFRDWLAGEISRGYRGVGGALARRWVKDHRLLLLLDGLDEVAEDRRAACVQALHDFVEEQGVPGLAVCCRANEYRALPFRLKLGGAVLLRPLEPAQIDAYLDAAGPALGGLRGALARDGELRELSSSPLMLSIMALAFRGLPAHALRFDETASREELRAEIFTRYVDRMFVLRGRTDGAFARARIEACLQWLASGMARRGESIFAIRLLQPAWLTPRQLLVYALVSRVAGVLILGFGVCLSLVLAIPPDRVARTFAPPPPPPVTAPMVAAFFGLATLVTGLLCFPVDYFRLRAARRRQLPFVLQSLKESARFFAYLFLSCFAAIVAVIATYGEEATPVQYGIISVVVLYFGAFGLAFAAFFGVKPGRGHADSDIGTVGQLVWRWKPAIRSAGLGCVVGLVYKVPAAGFLVGLAFGGWRYAVPPVETSIEHSLRSSALNAVRGALILSLMAFLVLLLRSPFTETRDVDSLLEFAVFAVTLMAIPGLLWFGGLDFGLHACLRLILSLAGALPLRLRALLDHAVHLGLLQRAGGGYIFIHRFLMEHFAASRSASSRPLSEAHRRMSHLQRR